jgi:hypothetical protein
MPLHKNAAISFGTAEPLTKRLKINIPEGVNPQWHRCDNLKFSISVLFNDLTDSSEKEASTGLRSVDNKLVRIWKEVGVCLFHTLP